jgi:hypothetical protein
MSEDILAAIAALRSDLMARLDKHTGDLAHMWMAINVLADRTSNLERVADTIATRQRTGLLRDPRRGSVACAHCGGSGIAREA